MKGHPWATALLASWAIGWAYCKIVYEPAVRERGLEPYTDASLSDSSLLGVALGGVVPQLVGGYLAYQWAK